jgi:hypothetical protein
MCRQTSRWGDYHRHETGDCQASPATIAASGVTSTGLGVGCCPALQVVILGIDPDASGAFTTLEWPAAAPRTADGLPSSLADAALQLFDMPMETIALGTRSRRSAAASDFRVYCLSIASAVDAVDMLLYARTAMPLRNAQASRRVRDQRAVECAAAATCGKGDSALHPGAACAECPEW